MIARYFCVGICLLSLYCLQAQDIKVDTGTIDGARFTILIPEGNTKKLVMYAHGYEFTGSGPSSVIGPEFPDRMKFLTDRGFAVAASAYQYKGFALPVGIEDTEALRKYFTKTYGAPDTTFIMGHSMGGGITIGLAERYPENYDGALPLCPLTSRPYLQTRKEFDLIAVFNVLYPRNAPSLKEIMDPNAEVAPRSMQETFAKAGAMVEMLEKDSVNASVMASRFELKMKDVPFTVLFGEGVLRDVAKKSGGNPYDNTNTIYSGFPDDWALNQKVERLASDQSAYAYMDAYNPTGNLTIPTVMMHTLYDQLISPRMAVENYLNQVMKAGNTDQLVVKYTNGQAHCAFTPEQHAKAFETLRNWTAGGGKPAPGGIE